MSEQHPTRPPESHAGPLSGLPVGESIGAGHRAAQRRPGHSSTSPTTPTNIDTGPNLSQRPAELPDGQITITLDNRSGIFEPTARWLIRYPAPGRWNRIKLWLSCWPGLRWINVRMIEQEWPAARRRRRHLAHPHPTRGDHPMRPKIPYAAIKLLCDAVDIDPAEVSHIEIDGNTATATFRVAAYDRRGRRYSDDDTNRPATYTRRFAFDHNLPEPIVDSEDTTRETPRPAPTDNAWLKTGPASEETSPSSPPPGSSPR